MCKIKKPIIDTTATAAKIKLCRICSGYSVRQVQIILGLSSPQAVYNWESGRDVPSIDNLIVIAELYAVTISDLVVTRYVEIDYDEDVEVLKSA